MATEFPEDVPLRFPDDCARVDDDRICEFGVADEGAALGPENLG